MQHRGQRETMFLTAIQQNDIARAQLRRETSQFQLNDERAIDEFRSRSSMYILSEPGKCVAL